jgi:hypothetical protein
MAETRVYKMLASNKDPDLDGAIQLALADEEALREVLAGVVSREDAYRHNCFKVLHRISEERPVVLYPEWDYFCGLLSSGNTYHRSTSVRIIASLACADDEGRFERIFDRYLDLLDDESVIPARYLAQEAGRIARSKPHLRTKIVERLLRIDETHHTQSRKDLIAADIIASFGEFFEEADAKGQILEFVERQLGNSSPKARKAARAFLSKYGR